MKPEVKSAIIAEALSLKEKPDGRLMVFSAPIAPLSHKQVIEAMGELWEGGEEWVEGGEVSRKRPKK